MIGHKFTEQTTNIKIISERQQEKYWAMVVAKRPNVADTRKYAMTEAGGP